MPLDASDHHAIAAPAAPLAVELLSRMLSQAPGDAEAALGHALRLMAERLEANRASAVIAARLQPEERKRNTAAGIDQWHPVKIFHAPQSSAEQMEAVEAWVSEGHYTDDPGTRRLLASAGRDRVQLARDAYGSAGPPGAIQELYDTFGGADRVVAGAPLAKGREIFFIIDRPAGALQFGPDEVALLEGAIPVLRVMGRRVARLLGWVDAREPLTRRESELLRLLLRGLTEKECAEELCLRPSSTHQVVVRVFRKLGVRTRAHLMALWLQHEPLVAIDGEEGDPEEGAPTDP